MASKSVHFIKERRLLSLIGVEYALASDTETPTKGKLYLTCCFIVVNAVLALVSMYYAFDNLFKSIFIGMLLALFFALLFFNLYVFLIQTFSKNSFTYKTKKMGIRLSNVTRIGFVLSIGFIVACPLYVLVSEKSIASNIQLYKQELIHAFNTKNAILHNKEIKRIDEEIIRYNLQSQLKILGAETNLKESKIKRQQEDEIYSSENIRAADEINDSIFFLKEIQVGLVQHTMSWLVIALVLLLFALPVFLVQSISSNNEYFIKRTESEKRLILFHYEKFKENYSSIFKRFGLDKSFHENYIDPPFNTTKPQEPELLSQDDFVKTFLINSK